jgi:hypothetical protein
VRTFVLITRPHVAPRDCLAFMRLWQMRACGWGVSEWLDGCERRAYQGSVVAKGHAPRCATPRISSRFRPGQSPLHGGSAESALGGRYHVCPYARWVSLFTTWLNSNVQLSTKPGQLQFLCLMSNFSQTSRLLRSSGMSPLITNPPPVSNS